MIRIGTPVARVFLATCLSVPLLRGAAVAQPEPTCENDPGAPAGLKMAPSSIVLGLEQVRGIRLIDATGASPSTVEWSMTDDEVAEVVKDGKMYVRGLAAGVTCVIATTPAGAVKSRVTVLSTTTVPTGTARWSLERASTNPYAYMRDPVTAQSDDGQATATFVFDDEDGERVIVRALDQDGLELWRRTENSMLVGSFGDARGGLVLLLQPPTGSSIAVRLDGEDGQESWRFTPAANHFLGFYSYTVRGDDVLFTSECVWVPYTVTGCDLIGLDLADGHVSTRISLPLTSLYPGFQMDPSLSPMITAEDSSVYVAVGTVANNSTPSGYTSHAELKMLRVASDGTPSWLPLKTFDYSGTSYDAYTIGGGELVPNGQGSVLLGWCVTGPTVLPCPSYMLVSAAGTMVDWPLNTKIDVIDGLGYAYGRAWDGATVITRLNPLTGARLWTSAVPNGSYSVQIVSARADGGVVVRDGMGDVRRYDATGALLGSPLPGPTGEYWLLSGNDLVMNATDHLEAFAIEDDLWGLWQTPGGSSAGLNRGPSPRLRVDAKSLTRGAQVLFRVDGGQAFSDWRFVPANTQIGTIFRVIGFDANFWYGHLVTSGTVSVQVDQRPTPLRRRVEIVKRTKNWKSIPVTPVEVPDGTDGHQLPDPAPPLAQNEDRPIGRSLVEIALGTSPTSAAVTDDGPNHGLSFMNQATEGTRYRYLVAASLKDTNSAFFQAQCGNYDAILNPLGLISGPNLLSNVVQHESGATGESHYANYSRAVPKEDEDRNLLAAVEEVVNKTPDFNATLTSTINFVAGGLLFDTAIEPCGGVAEYDGAAQCLYRGRINHLPFESCTP